MSKVKVKIQRARRKYICVLFFSKFEENYYGKENVSAGYSVVDMDGETPPIMGLTRRQAANTAYKLSLEKKSVF